MCQFWEVSRGGVAVGGRVQMIDSTRDRAEPLTLELGVGEIVGNPLVQALETAVRSHGVGDVVELQLKGGDYNPDLLFRVPADHPEIERLQGRYRAYAPPRPPPPPEGPPGPAPLPDLCR